MGGTWSWEAPVWSEPCFYTHLKSSSGSNLLKNSGISLRSWQYFPDVILPLFSHIPFYKPFIWFKMQVSWQMKFPATCQHLATTFSLFHSTQSLFFNREHVSVPKKPWKFKWSLEGLQSTMGFRNLRSSKGTMQMMADAQWAMPPLAAQTRESPDCHLGNKRIINKMSTLCGSWGQLGDIVQFLPEVCWPGYAFFWAAGQCDIAAHVQGPLDSAKRDRRRNCERRGEGDSKSGNVTKQWSAGSL